MSVVERQGGRARSRGQNNTIISLYVPVVLVHNTGVNVSDFCTQLETYSLTSRQGGQIVNYSNYVNVFKNVKDFPQYSINNCTFRWKTRRETFEALRLYCSKNLSNIPLTFMLGFYVSLVVNRWWKQYKLLPWPDSFSIMVTGLVTYYTFVDENTNSCVIVWNWIFVIHSLEQLISSTAIHA